MVPIWPFSANDICPLFCIMIRMPKVQNDFFGNFCHNIAELNIESDGV